MTALSLAELPELEIEVCPQSNDDHVELDAKHESFIGKVSAAGCGEWDSANHCLKCHTFGVKKLFDDSANKFRGSYNTIATGSGGQSDRNCYGYPMENGGWKFYRYGKNTKEHSSWHQSTNGHTTCEFNVKHKKSAGGEAAKIVDVALSHCTLFHTSDGTPFAAISRNGHLETMPIGDEAFHGLLRLWFTEVSGVVAKQDWMKNATQQLKAIALHDRPEKRVHLRIAPADKNRIYVDLCDSDRNVVEITADGWRVTQDVPVLFRRPASSLPLAMPVPGGSLSELWKFVNIREEDRALLAGTADDVSSHGSLSIDFTGRPARKRKIYHGAKYSKFN